MSIACRLLPRGDAWPTVTDDLPAKFVLFIACDTCSLSTDELGRAAQTVLQAGAVWISVWGPDCERFHDIIDEMHVGDGQANAGRSDIITTWHTNESLDEALLSFMDMTRLYYDRESTWVAVAVARADWYDQIRARLDDPNFPDLGTSGND